MFSTGDKVLVKPNAKDIHDGMLAFVHEMLPFQGEICTIHSVDTRYSEPVIRCKNVNLLILKQMAVDIGCRLRNGSSQLNLTSS